jgi:hypothetical protein
MWWLWFRGKARYNNTMPRRFQFSLRALLVLMVSTAVVLGIASWLSPGSRDAVAAFITALYLWIGLFVIAVLLTHRGSL